jgi:tripartite-type tricarboxylate transporter receptor subunit TctC
MALFFRAIFLCCLVVIGGGAIAQTFPSRPVRIVIGFPPGGGIDIVARLMAPKLTEQLGQPVIIDNKPGANGVLGMDFVAQAPADGHTLFLGTLGNFSINPIFYPNLPFNFDKQFIPLTELASLSFVLFVNPSLPVKSVNDLIGYAKNNPGKLNFSSSSSGGLPHLAGELFANAIGAKMVHIPYKGSAASISDVMSGQVQLTFEAAPAGMQHVKSGRLRALATTGLNRQSDLPTMAESVPGFSVVNWYGVAAPAGTPKEHLTRLHYEIKKVLAMPEIKEKMIGMGIDPVGSSQEEFAAFIKSESIKWARIIKDAQVKPD